MTLAREIPLTMTLIRRYIAWTERRIIHQCIQLRRTDLEDLEACGELPEGMEVQPLSHCGSEWLRRRVHNETAADGPGFRPASLLHIIALRSAPHHDPSCI